MLVRKRVAWRLDPCVHMLGLPLKATTSGPSDKFAEASLFFKKRVGSDIFVHVYI